MALLSHHILYAIKHTVFLITDHGLPKHINALLATIVRVTKKEVGLQGNTVNARLLAKLNDMVGATRVNLLLTHLHDTLTVHQKTMEAELIADLPDIVSLLLFVVYHSNIPSTVRLAARTLKTIFSGGATIAMQELQSPTTKEYLW